MKKCAFRLDHLALIKMQTISCNVSLQQQTIRERSFSYLPSFLRYFVKLVLH